MIYSINEGFFDNNKPNKIILENISDSENCIKDIIKYFEDTLKIITNMKNIVSKENFSNSDNKAIKDNIQKLSDLDTVPKNRKLTIAVNKLIKSYHNKDLEEINFPEGTSNEYKNLVKKVSKHGQYTKALINISHKFFKLNDCYNDLHDRYREFDSDRKTACEQFGGIVGYMIGSMPVVQLKY